MEKLAKWRINHPRFRKREKTAFSSLRKKTVAFILSFLLLLTSVLGTGLLTPVNVQAAVDESIKYDPKPDYDDYPEIDRPPVFSSYQEAVNYIGKMNAYCIKYKKSKYNGFVSYYDPDFQYTSEYLSAFTDATHLATSKELGDPNGQHVTPFYPTGISIMSLYSYDKDTHIVETNVGTPAAYSTKGAAMERELNEEADILLASLNLDGLSDYEKAYRIYRWVSNNVKYKLGANYNQMAYGALIGRACVCSGYADLIYVLYNKVGIETHLDWGADHEWNVVKMDGQYYYCDPTNDRSSKYPWEYPYTNFLMGINSTSETAIVGNGEEDTWSTMHTGEYFSQVSQTGSYEKFHIADEDYAGNTIIPNLKCQDEDHSFELIKTLPANCQHAERKIYNCSVCGSEYKVEEDENGAKGEHDYTLIEIKGNGNCTEPTEKTYFCEICEDQKTETTPAGDHAWDDGTVTKEPTCSEAGVKTYSCKNCDATKTEPIEKVAHTEEPLPAKDATCTEKGLTEGKKCSVCGEILVAQEETEMAPHSWDDGVVTKEATCSEAGVKTYTCKNCDATKTEPIEKVPHSEENLPARDATCTQTGLTAGKKCKVCGEILVAQEETEMVPHSWDDGTVTKEPTCSEAGVKTYSCKNCDATKTEPIEKVAHTEEPLPAKDATCTEKGLTEGKKCSVCGEILVAQEETEMVPHSWDDGTVTKEATCSEAGVKTYTCKNCDATKTEPINKIAHTSETLSAKDATCTETGLTAGEKCKVCGEIITAQTIVPALGHKHTEIRNAEKATCSKAGYTGDTYCLDCKEKIASGSVIPKTAHSWDSGRVTKNPTYDTTGIKTYTCTACRTTKTESIAKLSRIYVSGIKITGMSQSIAAGKKVQLTATVSPSNATTKAVKWSSSNTKVATVSQTGLVTFKKKTGGKTVVITAEATDGSGKKATYKLKSMKGYVKSISISGAKSIKAGQSLKLTAKVKATSGANKAVIWTSSNTKYATVSSSGKVKALSAGKGKSVKITASAVDGSGKKKTVTIKIKK